MNTALLKPVLKHLAADAAFYGGGVFAPTIAVGAFNKITEKGQRKNIDELMDAWDKSEKVGPLGARRLIDRQNRQDGTDIRPEWVSSRIYNSWWSPLEKKIYLLHKDAPRDRRLTSILRHMFSSKVPKSVLLHELGHAHESLPAHEIIKNQLDGIFMPFRRLKNNKVYKEEVRAWDNARKSDANIDERLREKALKTYEYLAMRNRVSGASMYLVAALVAARVIRNRRAGLGAIDHLAMLFAK